MQDEISDIELNRMAAIDGEEPFFPDIQSLKDDELVANLDDAMKFSLVVRKHLALGVGDEDVSSEWIDLIQNFELGQEDEKKLIHSESNSFWDGLRNMFSSLLTPRLALGTAFSVALLGGLFLQMQDSEPDWLAQYDGIKGAPHLVSLSDAEFTGSFFNQSSAVFRSSESETMVYQELFSALKSENTSWKPAESELANIEPVLKAMGINQEYYGRIPVDDRAIWFSLRGHLQTATEGTGICQLFQITEDSLEEPESARFGFFISYCPQRFVSRIEFLGATLSSE